MTGVARVLRRERPDTKIILSEPANAQLVGSGTAQPRNSDGSPSASHMRIRAASDTGLDSRFHTSGAAGGDRQILLRRSDSNRRGGRREMGQGARAERRESFAVYRAARLWAWRCRSLKKRPRAPSSWRCFPTLASGISPPLCLRVSSKTWMRRSGPCPSQRRDFKCRDGNCPRRRHPRSVTGAGKSTARGRARDLR